MGIVVWAQEAVFIHICINVIILDCLGQVSCRCCTWVELPVQRRLPDFLKWRRVTRRPLVFRGLTGSQRTPGFWAITGKSSNGHMTIGKEGEAGWRGREMWGGGGGGGGGG